MDLTPYTCRGFPGDFDRAMADVPVRGIDREQTLSMIRLCPQTEPILYGQDFSPRKIRYRRGSRPGLEDIANTFPGTSRQRVAEAMVWAAAHVTHPHFIGDIPGDRALPEEDLIASACGWCNEQSRVFIALCEVMEIPARLCFLFHANGHTAHTGTEVFLDGHWAFHDVTYGVTVELPDGRLAEARELQGKYRSLAHAAYKHPMIEYYARGRQPPGSNAPPVEAGGDFFHAIGISNYVIEGVDVVHQ